MSEHLNIPLLQKSPAAECGGFANPLPASKPQKHSCAFCTERGAGMSERIETTSLFDIDGRRKYLSAEERGRFVNAAKTFSPKIEALCLLLHFTGCRVSEAIALRPYHLDAEAGIVILQTLKQRRRGVFRMMPLPGAVMDKLSACLPATQSAPLFDWHRTTAWEKVSNVMAKAEISGPQACPRGVRHGFGVAAVSAGVPITLVQRWLGHSRLETTSIYLAITGSEERKFAAKLWRKSMQTQRNAHQKEAA